MTLAARRIKPVSPAQPAGQGATLRHGLECSARETLAWAEETGEVRVARASRCALDALACGDGEEAAVAFMVIGFEVPNTIELWHQWRAELMKPHLAGKGKRGRTKRDPGMVRARYRALLEAGVHPAKAKHVVMGEFGIKSSTTLRTYFRQ